MKSPCAGSLCIDGNQLTGEVWGPNTKTGASDACSAPFALTAPRKLQDKQTKVCWLCRLQQASKSMEKYQETGLYGSYLEPGRVFMLHISVSFRLDVLILEAGPV